MTVEHRSRRRLALKRLVLSALPVFASGCLVADPPQYEGPATTPVFLDLAASTPVVGRVIVRNFPATIDFDVPIRSEDNGDQVTFALYQDFGFPQRQRAIFCSRRLAPGTFDESDRSLRFSETLRMAPVGCFQLTLLVAHADNWDFENCRPDLVRGIGDTSIATWWLNVIESGQEPTDLNHCPSPSEIQQ